MHRGGSTQLGFDYSIEQVHASQNIHHEDYEHELHQVAN